MGLPYRTIAVNLNVSVGTVYNIWRQFDETGTVVPRPHPSHERKLSSLDETFIIGIVLENPAVYLREIAQSVEEVLMKQVSPSTICRVIHKHGFTRKKLHQVAKQRSVLNRGKYMSEVQLFKRDAFVFVNETGCSGKDHIRKFGYAVKGENAIQRRWLHRVSAIAAISSTGVVCMELYTGSINSDVFYDFARGYLIP